MNFSQRLGLFILIIISVSYVYFSFFKDGIKSPNYNQEQADTYNPMVNFSQEDKNEEKLEKQTTKNVKIFLLDEKGKMSYHSNTRLKKERSSKRERYRK